MTKRKLIPCAGQEPRVTPANQTPLVKIRKILSGLTPAHAHAVSVKMEYESAAREYDERQLEARLAHDH